MSEQEWLHQPGEGLDPTAQAPAFGLGPVLDADRATIVAVFADAEAARACFQNLQAREVQVALEAADAAWEETPVEAHLRERAMGRGVVLGATVGATVGFLAGTYLVPPGAATATGTMVTTLAGAGLGSFVGSMVDRDVRPAGRMGATGAEGSASGAARSGTGPGAGAWRLSATVDRAEVDEVMDLIAPWKPGELRVE